MSRLEITTPDSLPEEVGAEAALRPGHLEEFVGQGQVKASLRIAIDAAKAREAELLNAFRNPSERAMPLAA